MIENKPWWDSLTIRAAISTILIAIATLTGLLSAEGLEAFKTELPMVLAALGTIVTAGLSWYGRARATHKLGAPKQ
jgi:hypothetical protein